MKQIEFTGAVLRASDLVSDDRCVLPGCLRTRFTAKSSTSGWRRLLKDRLDRNLEAGYYLTIIEETEDGASVEIAFEEATDAALVRLMLDENEKLG